MAVDKRIALDLEALPMDVFDVAGGATVESLTAGHGMTEVAASCSCYWYCSSNSYEVQ